VALGRTRDEKRGRRQTRVGFVRELEIGGGVVLSGLRVIMIGNDVNRRPKGEERRALLCSNGPRTWGETFPGWTREGKCTEASKKVAETREAEAERWADADDPRTAPSTKLQQPAAGKRRTGQRPERRALRDANPSDLIALTYVCVLAGRRGACHLPYTPFRVRAEGQKRR
jgi:hypothetical protein